VNCPDPIKQLTTGLLNRRAVVSVFVGVFLVALASTVRAGTAKNILLVIADDYGADGSSHYNSAINDAGFCPIIGSPP